MSCVVTTFLVQQGKMAAAYAKAIVSGQIITVDSLLLTD
jgi:hypothetical protein